MKRNEFLKHLKKFNCNLLREGGRHSLFINTTNGKQSAVPRHPELSDLLCKIICKQLEIPPIKNEN
jgi:mRNA interferase HicA